MRVLIYNSSARGSGQFLRSLKFAETIASGHRTAEVLVLAGNSYASKASIPNIETIRLPEVRKTLAGICISQLNDLPRVFAVRRGIVESVIRDFEPNFFFVDSRPMGLNGELEPALEALRSRRQCATALVLRDIIDAPEIVRRKWTDEGWYEAVPRLYDSVLICGEPQVFDPVFEYGFESFRDKVEYLGYFGIRRSSIRDETTSPYAPSPVVLVTAGGGYDGEDLMRVVCEYILAHGGDYPNVQYVLVLGDNSPIGEQQLLSGYPAIRARIQVYQHVDDLAPLMRKAQVVVSMGGYNSIAEALYLNKKLIVVPRRVSGREQLLRGDLLSRNYPGVLTAGSESLDVPRLSQLLSKAWRLDNPKRTFRLDASARLLAYVNRQSSHA